MDNKNTDDVLEVSLGDIFHSLKSHIGLVIFLGLLCFGLAVAYIFYLTVPVYQSTVSMIVNPLKSSSSISDIMEGTLSSGNTNITTELELITSSTNIKNALALLNLNNYKDADEVTYKEFFSDSENVRKLKDKIAVTSASNSRSVTVSVKDTDMNFASDYANALAQSYKDYLAFLAKNSKMAQRETIEKQIPENEVLLNSAREKLAQYNADYGTSQIQSKIEVLNPQISLIQLQKTPLEIEIEKNKETIPSYFLVMAPKDQNIQSLLDQYRQQMKEYLLYSNVASDISDSRVLSLSSSIETISQAIYSAVLQLTGSLEVAKPLADYLTVSAKYDVLTELETGYVEELAGYQTIIVELQELESNVAIYESLVLSLKQMLEETKVLESSVESNVIIVDPAEPNEKPVSPRTLVITAAALVGGWLVGFAIGLFIDLSDQTITSESKIRDILGEDVTSLGWIPYAKVLPNGSTLYALYDSDGYTSERYRILASNIALVTEEKKLKVFTICSTDRSEGKSTATINTAVTFASLGKKVLVVDGDLRRPELENYFNIAHAKYGLSDVVMGKAFKEQVIIRPIEKLPTLHLMPAGAGISNPNIVFNSEKFSKLIKELKSMYDYVFIDCPPLSFGSDFMLITRSVDAYVISVRAGSTTRQGLADFNEQRKAFSATFMGYIFYGRLLTKSNNRYGYGYGYNSYSYDYNNKKKDNSQSKDSYKKIIKKELSQRTKHSKHKGLIQAPLAFDGVAPIIEREKPQPKKPVPTLNPTQSQAPVANTKEDEKPIEL